MKFTVEQFKKYLESQESFGDAMYNLTEEDVLKANQSDEVIEIEDLMELKEMSIETEIDVNIFFEGEFYTFQVNSFRDKLERRGQEDVNQDLKTSYIDSDYLKKLNPEDLFEVVEIEELTELEDYCEENEGQKIFVKLYNIDEDEDTPKCQFVLDCDDFNKSLKHSGYDNFFDDLYNQGELTDNSFVYCYEEIY